MPATARDYVAEALGAPGYATGNSRDDSGELSPLDFVDIAAWDGLPVPQRKWVVLNRVPDEDVTLLSGEGAVGKSILIKQLAVATVTAKDWLGTMPEPGSVIYVTAEDKRDELHFRLDAIARHYDTRFRKLGDLHIRSLKGEDSVLAYPDRQGIVQPTKLFDRLLLAARTIRPRWVGLDPSANLFAGNENDRSQVQQFIGLLTRIAVQCQTAVILVSHPSLTGLSTGSGLSGSTAWSNSVRSRLYLRKATTAQGEEPDPNLRELEVMKANYAPAGERTLLRWHAGVFVLEHSAEGSLERMARDQKIDEAFLALLRRFIEQRQDVNHKPGPSYAPKRFAQHPEAGGTDARAFAKAMQRLLDAGRIKIEIVGRPSRPSFRIVPA
jgi:RecA-family ATPase